MRDNIYIDALEIYYTRTQEAIVDNTLSIQKSKSSYLFCHQDQGKINSSPHVSKPRKQYTCIQPINIKMIA